MTVLIKEKIEQGKTCLGIELGSTRIKACLIDDTFKVVASGSYEWENKIENGYWTYSLEDIHNGIKGCYAGLAEDVMKKYSVSLTVIGAIGISGMMHGFMPFDKNNCLLTPFRTWRNTNTRQASSELTSLFNFNIPQRWSIAHLYQAILNGESYVSDISYITTLAGYIHFRLTGALEAGVGEASGMFPVENKEYNPKMLSKFNDILSDKGIGIDIKNILPKIRLAGENGARLTEAGAKFLDPSGNLKAGIPICPPEGDAGTGMVATNSVLPKTGNISAGTSIFSMLVLERPLENVYPEIDILTTPDASPVAMVHCNNCCSELDVWVKIFGEFAELAGTALDKAQIYEMLYRHTASSDADCACITAYNYLSGEPVTGVENGHPMYFRTPASKMNLANFMKSQLYSSVSALSIGMDLLLNKEKAEAFRFLAHGGLFKVKGVAQQILADSLNTPISVFETASEGGAWGMALLAAYMIKKQNDTLGEWLQNSVFKSMSVYTLSPEPDSVKIFSEYIKQYKAGLPAENKLEELPLC